MRSKRDAGLLWLMCLIVAPPAAAQLSLAQAMQAARINDPKYQVALREHEGSLEYRIAGRAAQSAEASLSASAGRNWLDQRVGSFRRDSAYNSTSATLQLRQPVYAPELNARERIGEARSLQGEAQLSQRNVELALRVVDSYTQVVVLRGQLDATVSLIQALEQQSHGAQRMIELGEGTRTDMLEAGSRLLLARAQRIEIADMLRDATRRLAIVVGPAVVATPRALAPRFSSLSLKPSTLEAWEEMALDANPQLRMARHAAQAALAEAERADAQRKPRLDMVVALSRADSDSVNTLNQVNTQASVGLQLNVPLYSGGRIDSAMRLAAAQSAQAQAELLDVQAAVLADVRLYFGQVQSTAAKVMALDAAYEAASLQALATQQSVKGGIRVTLDVLNAETQRYEVTREQIRARTDHMRAWVRLRVTVGALLDADVALLDGGFDDKPPAPGRP